jgi:HEAT repeat protein
VFLYVAGLDEASSERLQKQCKWEKTPWRVAAARFAPVTVPQDRKLTADEAKKLLAGLKDEDPAARVRALVSVPPTATPEMLAATLRLLDDPYKEWAGMVDPVQVLPLSTVADGTLSRLGSAAVEPLIAYAGAGDDRRKATVAAILGPIGRTEAGEKFLRAAIESNTGALASAAQKAAAGWGQNGLTITRAIVADPKIGKGIRRDAIAAIGNYGDLKTDGPTLRKLLNSAEMDVQWATVAALGRMKDVDSLPEFERIARDGQIDQNTRYPAVTAVLALADAKTGDKLLLDLVNRKDDRLRGFALKLAGERKVAGTLPLALAALDDTEWYTRVMADYALRGLAGDRTGVGYDPRKPDAKLWRGYWAKNEKK